MGLGLIIIITTAILLFLIISGSYLISVYNGLISLKNNIKKSWSNIDVLLKQRFNEIPSLVSTVKGYMKYEKNTLKDLTLARSAFLKSNSINQKANADLMASSALKSLFAVAEKYPDLKANTTFNHLQDRISHLEREIADRREFYNESVNLYNVMIKSFPPVLIANILGYKKEPLFQVTSSEKKQVNINL